MKITDMIVSALLKKGVLFESRNVETSVDIPRSPNDVQWKGVSPEISSIKITIKADNVKISLEKGE